jgi:hypothetical protein
VSYTHLLGVANANEPLLPTDVRDLATVLDVPLFARCANVLSAPNSMTATVGIPLGVGIGS